MILLRMQIGHVSSSVAVALRLSCSSGLLSQILKVC